MNITDHYINLSQKALSITKMSMSEKDLDTMASNHSFLHDFTAWLQVLDNRPEYDILYNAIKEYQIALLCCAQGMYQQAFMGLRFFLERTFVAVLFSTNELELNLWKLGERDTYWNEVASKDPKSKEIIGIFSSRFCKAFFPELDTELQHYYSMSIKVYRECSEYVHGNKSIIDKIPNTFEYSEELFNEWNDKADTIKQVVLFVFCLRYLKNLNQNQIEKISPTIQDEFRNISHIKRII